MIRISSSFALLLIGAALSIGVYLVDDSILPAHTGQSSVGGIFEQQILDDSVVVNPDRFETSPVLEGNSVSYPLRLYWPYPLVGAVLICLASWLWRSKSDKALQSSLAAREGKAEPKELAVCKKNDTAPAGRDVAAPAPPPPGGSEDKPLLSTVPTITNKNELPSSLEKTAEAYHTMVSAERMIQLSSELRRLKQVLPEADFKAIHKLFLAVDENNNCWTVDLKGKTWHKKVGGKWTAGSPPPCLYISNEFTAAIRSRCEQR